LCCSLGFSKVFNHFARFFENYAKTLEETVGIWNSYVKAKAGIIISIEFNKEEKRKQKLNPLQVMKK